MRPLAQLTHPLRTEPQARTQEADLGCERSCCLSAEPHVMNLCSEIFRTSPTEAHMEHWILRVLREQRTSLKGTETLIMSSDLPIHESCPCTNHARPQGLGHARDPQRPVLESQALKFWIASLAADPMWSQSDRLPRVHGIRIPKGTRSSGPAGAPAASVRWTSGGRRYRSRGTPAGREPRRARASRRSATSPPWAADVSQLCGARSSGLSALSRWW
jgi:hypothetical protein